MRAGAHVWTLAGTFGAALGPALGGALTQAFDWRAIFVFQAPIAGVALLAAFGSHVRSPTLDPSRGPLRRTFPANVALALVFGALVGALFLAVLLGRHRLGVLAARRCRDRVDPAGRCAPGSPAVDCGCRASRAQSAARCCSASGSSGSRCCRRATSSTPACRSPSAASGSGCRCRRSPGRRCKRRVRAHEKRDADDRGPAPRPRRRARPDRPAAGARSRAGRQPRDAQRDSRHPRG